MARRFNSTVREIPPDPPVLAEVNASKPWTEGTIRGKVVILKKSALLPDYQLMDRRFKPTDGFGTSLGTRGSAVYGTLYIDGEVCRFERSDIEGLAVNPELPVVHYGKN